MQICDALSAFPTQLLQYTIDTFFTRFAAAFFSYFFRFRGKNIDIGIVSVSRYSAGIVPVSISRYLAVFRGDLDKTCVAFFGEILVQFAAKLCCQ